MATIATQQPQMGLSFEQVWAGFMELRARQAETNELMRKNAEEHRKTEEIVNKMAVRVDQTSVDVRKMAEKWIEYQQMMVG